MEADKIIKILSRNSRVLNNLDEHEILDVLKLCVTRACRDKEIVFAEDSPGNEMYIIVSGSVVVKKAGKVIDVIRPGECFGEMAAWTDEPRSATTEADGDLLLLEVSSDKFDSLQPGIQVKLLKNILIVISARLAERIEDITH